MNNLLNTYNQILSNKRKWKYYNKLNVNFSPFTKNNAWKFIESYYKAGEKGRVFSPLIKQENIRPLHSVSVFFLGILLKNIILKNTHVDFTPDFRYLWFMTALYHDYAFVLEKDKRILKAEGIHDLESLKQYLKISADNDIFSDNFNGKFSLDTIKSYLKYTIDVHNKLDHGIVGGLLLYKGLRDNYEVMFNEKRRKDSSVRHEYFKYKGLMWSECQYDNFKRIAKAIINHNIWFCYKGGKSPKDYEECKNEYQKYRLSNLIINNEKDYEKKHQLKNDPFLLLLILADTIEPIKFFRKEKAEHILSNIKIENSKGALVITVLKDLIDTEKWLEKIIDLKNWTTISVTRKNGNSLIISNYN